MTGRDPESPPVSPSDWDSFLWGMFRRREDSERSTGTLGMSVFLTSLTVLFIASIVGYLVVRTRADQWGPAGGSHYPGTLWISTLIILGASVTMQIALAAARFDAPERLRKMLTTTLVLGLVFLLMQLANWLQLWQSGTTARTGLYGFTFYMFTVLHALHVIGGLIPLGIVTRKAHAGAYSGRSHAGVQYVTMYWHFLDAVWIVLFVIILIG